MDRFGCLGPLIELRSVSYTYPAGVRAVVDVDLEVREGEVVAVMGGNGAGKTTLLKLMVGLLKPSAGSVLVDGLDTRSTPLSRIARLVGYVPQIADSLFFLPTVEEEMTYALRNFKIENGAERARELLRAFGLEGTEKRSPFTLSGGQKKRLSIAVVLSWDPKYVLLDEPTLGQDKAGREVMMGIVRQLSSQGRSLVIATHDVEFVSELSPRVVLMGGGRVIADGRAEEVLTDEELLRKARVLPPQSVAISSRLERFGVRRTPSIRELHDQLRSLLSRGGGCSESGTR
ncbi:MAG: ABC transporter ATP-binding protein [Nitrososphaerota archaeon]